MLPDLWRMADRRMRARAEVASRPPVGEDPPLEAALAGIRHHLALDVWFHASPFFVEGEALTRSRFLAACFSAARMRLLAHVAWELALDGALVRSLGPEEARRRVATDLERAREVFPAAARLHARARPPERLESRLEDLLGRLAESSWIPGYAEPEGLADRLAGVRRRVGLAPLSGRDRGELAHCFEDLAAAADRSLTDLVADRCRLFAPNPSRRGVKSTGPDS